MQIHLSEISASDGKIIEVDAPFEREEISFGQGRFPVLDHGMVHLRIENTGNHVLAVSGKGTIKVRIPCDRCLRPVDTVIPLEFERKLDMRQSEGQRIEDLDEAAYLTGMDLDVDCLVYLEALIGWPAKVLCKEDCKGICSRCGKDLNKGPCGCDSEPKDPRMAVISEIFSKYKEV